MQISGWKNSDVRTLLEHYDLDLSGADVHTLTQRTEGWLAGVQLAALVVAAQP